MSLNSALWAGVSGLSANELVYDVPHAHFINASFAYAKPREPNRFNGENRGAWYSALEVETCLAEITFHMTEFLARTGVYQAVADYAEMVCSVSGAFLDLSDAPGHLALSPDKSIGYPQGNQLALEAKTLLDEVADDAPSFRRKRRPSC